MTKTRPNIFSFAALLFLALSLAAIARGANFTASLDRDTIALGETATLSLKFDGVQPQNEPVPPAVSGLQFQYVGPSSAFSFINGQTSSSITYNYIVSAQSSGQFTIPAITANVNGHQLTSQPLELIVQKANVPTAAAINSGSQIAFMKLVLPKKEMYEGEVIGADLEVWLRDDIQNFGNFHLTATPADGFNIGKMTQGSRSRRQIGNHIYTVIPLSFTLTAIKTGALNIGPIAASAVIVLPSGNSGGDPFFRQFFNQGEQKQISLATDPQTIQSLPLPTENVPANFNGAVGDYTLTVAAGPTHLAVGDPITVRVKISGRGALDSLALPEQSDWKNFKIFPPTSKVETTDALGIEGSKTFEEIVTPENTDVRELPPFSFSYFDPDRKIYRTLTQPAVQLAVHSGGTVAVPTIAANKNSAPENQTPQDILPIKNDLGTLASRNVPLVTHFSFLITQSVPVLAFLAALVWRKRTENLANNPRLRRKIAVEKLVKNGILDLRKFAMENNSEEFFATLFRLLQEQLGERLDCPAVAITENVVEANSVLRRAPDALRAELRELFQLCNQARYAPMRGVSELNFVSEKFENVIQEFQNVKV